MQLVLQVMLASAAVIGLVYISLRLLNSGMSGRLGGNHFRVIEAVSVGRKAHVTLVRVVDRHLILGVTENNVTVLGEVDLDCEEIHNSDERSSSRLTKVLGRWGNENRESGS